MDISEQEMSKAREVFETLCKALDNDDWRYQRNDEKLSINFGATGDDLPMEFVMFIDPKPGYVRLLSWLPFKINEDKIVDAAIATCAINYQLKNGTFDFNINEGEIVYRITQAYFDSTIGEEVLMYLIKVSCYTIDDYNDKFLMLSKGNLALKDFLDEIEG